MVEWLGRSSSIPEVVDSSPPDVTYLLSTCFDFDKRHVSGLKLLLVGVSVAEATVRASHNVATHSAARRVPNLGGPHLRKLIDFLRSMQFGICGTDSQRGEWRRASAPGKGVRADQPPTPFSTPVSKACRSRAQSVPQLARLCCSAAMLIQQKEQSCAR